MISFDPATALLELGKSAIDKIWPDPIKRAEQYQALEQLRQNGEIERLHAEVSLIVGQLDINKIEAAHPSIFVAGWRPAIGWVGAIAMGYTYVVEPMARFVGTVFFDYNGAYPVLDLSGLWPIIAGMLGIAGLRSWDKSNDKETKGVK